MPRLGNSTTSSAVAEKSGKSSRKNRPERSRRDDATKNNRSKSTGRERDAIANNKRDNSASKSASKSGGNSSSKRRDVKLTVTMQRADETKNKIKYIELDEDGDMVENAFRDGIIGQIYLPKTEIGSGPKTIKVSITAE